MSTGKRGRGILERILAAKRTEIASACAETAPPMSTRAAHDVRKALARARGGRLHLIAEIKFKSPSAGELSRDLDAAARAIAYAEGGASMISVLCDGPFFGGSWSDLEAVRAALDLRRAEVPLLAKEFVLDEIQLARARSSGADAVLLIARILHRTRLGELARAARDMSLEPLVEVVDERELEAAVAADARVIGVNARDLDTLIIDHDRARRVLDAVPRESVAIHLSGIKDPSHVRELASGRADAALVGEALMRTSDPRAFLRSLVAAGSGALTSPW